MRFKKELDSRIKMEMYRVAGEIAKKYYIISPRQYTENLVREFWSVDEHCPALSSFWLKMSIKKVKWYIHNKMVIEDDIWNADFYHGLSYNAIAIRGQLEKLPSIRWYNNQDIIEIAKNNPFSRDVRIIQEAYNSKMYSWTDIFPLQLKTSKESSSFIAGVLSVGEIVTLKENGREVTYVKFGKRAKNIIDKFGIPIERTIEKKSYIAPIWGALLSYKMPEVMRSKWSGIKNGFNSELYATILWRTYISKDYVKDGLPYLKSRRMIFYKYKNDELGAVKKIERLRVSTGLINLDNSIKVAVREYVKNNKKINKEDKNEVSDD